MQKLRDIRVFTRTPDGTVRQAIHFGDRPEWEWVISGSGALDRRGDLILNLSDDKLPQNADEFFLGIPGARLP
jgi:hypothetical protein